MTVNRRPRNYALDSTDAEHERLIRQAAAPLTERFCRDAGIGPGQRVLDEVAASKGVARWTAIVGASARK